MLQPSKCLSLAALGYPNMHKALLFLYVHNSTMWVNSRKNERVALRPLYIYIIYDVFGLARVQKIVLIWASLCWLQIPLWNK